MLKPWATASSHRVRTGLISRRWSETPWFATLVTEANIGSSGCTSESTKLSKCETGPVTCRADDRLCCSGLTTAIGSSGEGGHAHDLGRNYRGRVPSVTVPRHRVLRVGTHGGIVGRHRCAFGQ